jgi:hypothetical protein
MIEFDCLLLYRVKYRTNFNIRRHYRVHPPQQKIVVILLRQSPTHLGI